MSQEGTVHPATSGSTFALSAGPKEPDMTSPAGGSPVVRAVTSTFRATYAFAGVAAIFALSYLFGHTLLEGILSGNDIPWALSMVQWYDRWFPHLPIWYPLQGAGTPLLFLYQPGTSLLVVLFHRLTGLTDIQAFRLIGFLSVPVGATGVYMLVWRKLGNQTAALLAGLLYPLSSGTWDWLARIGLYGQSVTIMVVPWALLAFDSYLSDALKTGSARPSILRRFMFPLAALVFGGMFVSHIPTAMAFVMAVTVYALLLPLLQIRGPKLWRPMATSVLRAWAGVSVGLLLASVWVLPFIRANLLANREGLSYIPAEQVSYYDLGMTLGLTQPVPAYRMTFAIPVVLLAAVGVVAGLATRKTPLSWGVVAFGSVVFVSMPGIWMGLVRIFAPLWEATNDRAVLLAIVLLPATAAYGACTLGNVVGGIPSRLLSLLGKVNPRDAMIPKLARLVGSGTAAVVSVAAVGLLVVYSPKLVSDRNGYGLQGWNGPLPIALKDGKLELLDPPQWVLSEEGDQTNRTDIVAFSQQLGFYSLTRVDVTPDLGGITEALSLYTDASIINIYGFNASLIHAMWAYQATVYYLSHYGSAREVNELAHWFGLQYVVLHKNLSPLERYDPNLWPIVYPQSDDNPTIVQVRRFTEAPEMASLVSRPVVLVIGGYQNGIYEQAFREFVKGALGYESGLAVEGVHNIDDYSLDQLRGFDAVFLHGYGYKDYERAWQLLEEFVASGGALYVDTGWQFFSPDWELEDTPPVLPVHNLEWTHFGIDASFTVEDPSLIGQTVPTELPPLIWEGQSWGVSVPSKGLRDWAHPVLSAEGVPVIAAGEYGQGRVVWSGMNLIGHAGTYDSDEERHLLGRLIGWLVGSSFAGEMRSPVVVREDPDHIRFLILDPLPEGTSLLWREAFSPDWRASIAVDGRVTKAPIYRAGPGMMLLQLPQTEAGGAVVTLEYHLGWIGSAGLGISLATAIGLVAGTMTPGLDVSMGKWMRNRPRRVEPSGSVEWLPHVTSSPESDRSSDEGHVRDENAGRLVVVEDTKGLSSED